MTRTPIAPQEQEAIHVLMTMITWCKNSEYEKATDLMTDDVQWKTPVFYFDGKSSGSKNSDAQLSVHQHLKTRKLREKWTEMCNIVITRKGTKKMGYLTIKFLKTVEVNSENKTCKANVAMA
jgi:hypothetical protein